MDKVTCMRCYGYPALFRLQTDILNLPVCLLCAMMAVEMGKEIPSFEYKLISLALNNNGRARP